MKETRFSLTRLYWDFWSFTLVVYERTLEKLLSQDERTESFHERKKVLRLKTKGRIIWTILTRLEVSKGVLEAPERGPKLVKIVIHSVEERMNSRLEKSVKDIKMVIYKALFYII